MEKPTTAVYIGDGNHMMTDLLARGVAARQLSRNTLTARTFHFEHERLWRDPVDWILVEPRGVIVNGGSRADRKAADAVAKLARLQLQRSLSFAVLAPRSNDFWNLDAIQQCRRDLRLFLADWQ